VKRKQLGKKESREINSQIFSEFGISEFIDKKANAELIDDKFVYVDGSAKFFYIQDKIIPTLKSILQKNFLKKITVDMGAVKFVAGGADIMRPGIKNIEPEIKAGQIITIVDEKNQKPLAIGQALFSSEEMRSKDSGKVVKNLHYVGDEIWNTN
jgi:PUA domain protein